MFTKSELDIILDALISSYKTGDDADRDKLVSKIQALETVPDPPDARAGVVPLDHYREALGVAMKNYISALGWTIHLVDDKRVIWKPPKKYPRPKKDYDFRHAVYSQIYRDQETHSDKPMTKAGSAFGILSNHQSQRRRGDQDDD